MTVASFVCINERVVSNLVAAQLLAELGAGALAGAVALRGALELHERGVACHERVHHDVTSGAPPALFVHQHVGELTMTDVRAFIVTPQWRDM